MPGVGRDSLPAADIETSNAHDHRNDRHASGAASRTMYRSATQARPDEAAKIPQPPHSDAKTNWSDGDETALPRAPDVDAADIEATHTSYLSGDTVARTSHSSEPTTNTRPLPQDPDLIAHVRSIETSTRNWDTPLTSVGDQYEPQGELRSKPPGHEPVRSEFSIPRAVPGSGIKWPFNEYPAASIDEESAHSQRPGFSRRNTNKRKSVIDELTTTQPGHKRVSRNMAEAGDVPPSPTRNREVRTQSSSQGAAQGSRARSAVDTNTDPRSNTSETSIPEQGSSGTGDHRALADSAIPMVLPARKVFPIQIGDKLFRLSGASISSDAPSYFSQFFEEQLRQNEGADNVRTLYIDRDPATFEDISLHLQGYHVEPRDGPHFVKLFADAQFFSLPRLTAQLFASTIYIRIGDVEFQIPRDLFSGPGDSPNYFSLGFAIFFTTPAEAFPGLSQRSLLRPPSILPPSVPNRSAKTFADLLHILKGYPLEIRNEQHRQELLRDARYYHLKGLEQKLIPHSITYNLARKKSEIILRLDDIRQSGISFVADSTAGHSAATTPAASPSASSTAAPSVAVGPGWVHYQRPYVDSEAHSLIIEISGDESTFLHVGPGTATSPARMARAAFHTQTLARITKLFSVIATKMNLPVTQPLGVLLLERGGGVSSLPMSPQNTGVSEDRVKVRIGPDADVIVDGQRWLVGEPTEDDEPAEEDSEFPMDIDSSRVSQASTRGKRTRRSLERHDEEEEWIVTKSQWRLRVQAVPAGSAGTGSGHGQTGKSSMEVILGAVKIDAYRTERARNRMRGFLS